MRIRFSRPSTIHVFLLLCLLFPAVPTLALGVPFQDGPNMSDAQFQRNITQYRQNMRAKMQREQRQKMQDRMSGLPQAVLDRQGTAKVNPVSPDQAVTAALAEAAAKAEELLDDSLHKNGSVLRVPKDFSSIQKAIDAAGAGDTILVEAGTYYEQLVMKDGIRLLSDSSDGGEEQVILENSRLPLPRRTLRTIIDGSKSSPSSHGMIDFEPGAGRSTIVDGFTVQNLPLQDHHIPGHAHGLNIRGASPVIRNCLIQQMGSTGIGSHVVFKDQDQKMSGRDFRSANISHPASAVLFNNLIRNNVGLGIGCNHYSSPFILGNEVYGNSDADEGQAASPGIGNKHGSSAVIIGNIVHDNPGGGIMAKAGMPQGRYPVDTPTHPTIRGNVVFANGIGRPGISARQAGSRDLPVVITGNHVEDAGAVGIGLTDKAVAVIEDNLVIHSRRPDISINNATALKLNNNKVLGRGEVPGITIVNHSRVLEMRGNSVDSGEVPRFMVDQGSTVR